MSIMSKVSDKNHCIITIVLFSTYLTFVPITDTSIFASTQEQKTNNNYHPLSKHFKSHQSCFL